MRGESCRICGRELCGNQRRWIFHPAAKVNLQVLLSHVLGQEVVRGGGGGGGGEGQRGGRGRGRAPRGWGEFACSKCAFMLERVFRFDTVIARIEALSLERLQKLLLEKDRLKLCLAGLYRKNNPHQRHGSGGHDPREPPQGGSPPAPAGAPPPPPPPPEPRCYSALLQEDFAYSGFECWSAAGAGAEEGERPAEGGAHPHPHPHPPCRGSSEGPWGRPPRRCRSCALLRVADADYEAICKVPRKVARHHVACAASPRGPASACHEEEGPAGAKAASSPLEEDSMGGGGGGEEEEEEEEETPGCPPSSSSSSSSRESLEAAGASQQQQQQEERREEEAEGQRRAKCDCCPEDRGTHGLPPQGNPLDLALHLVKAFGCKPVQSPPGSKLPVPVKANPLGQDPVEKSTYSSFPNVALKSHSGSAFAFPLEMSDLQELWEDLCAEYIPLQVKNLYEDQEQLSRCNLDLGKQTSELNNAELLEKINSFSATNKQLQEKLNEINFELKSVQHTSWTQDHKIKNMTEVLKIKENESEELNHVIESQNETIAKLQEMLHKSQLGQLKISEGTSASQQQQQIGLLNVQNTLFFTQLELQRLKRVQQQKDRQLDEARQTTHFLEALLQEEQRQKEAAWKHSQELRTALQQLEAELQKKNSHYCTVEREKWLEIQSQEQKIKHLNQKLTYKEQLLQESKELLQYHQNRDKAPTTADRMVQKLQQRIKDRDAALERAIDEKFSVLEDREQELQQLRLSTKERERDLEGLHQVLSNNKATIQDLENLLKARDLEREHLVTTYQKLQWMKKEVEAKTHKWEAGQEEIIRQLHTALCERNKEVEALLTTLLCKLLPGQRGIVEELYLRLQQKEQIIERLLSTKSLQAVEQVAALQELLQTVSTREQQHHVAKQGSGKTTAAKISEREDLEPKTQKAVSEATAGLEKELLNAREELELLTRKERECRLELSALQSVVASQEEELQVQASDVESLTRSNQIKEELIKDLQMQLVDPEEMPAIERLTREVLVLQEKVAQAESQGQDASGSRRLQLALVFEGLAAERNQLNETLKAEKQLYGTLVKLHTHPDRSGTEETLQAELAVVQALHGQLEEALGRSLERLSRLESLESFGGGEQECVTVLPKHAF